MRKQMAGAGILLSAILVLTGCGGVKEDNSGVGQGQETGRESTADTESVTIRMLNDGEGVWEESMDPIVARWNELHPEAQLEMEYHAYGTTDEVIEMNLGMKSTDYDIIAVDTPKIADYSEKGYLIPLDAHITEDEVSKLQAPCIEASRYNDQLMVMPMQTGISVLYYNKTLLDKAGITVRENGPDNRLTFEELTELSKQALDKLDPEGTAGICGLTWGQVNKTYAMLQLPASFGGIQIGEDETTLKGVVDSEAWRKAYTFYQGLYQEGVSTYGISADDANGLFQSGKVLFMINSYSRWKNYQKNEDYEFVMCYNPVFEGYEEYASAPTGSWNVGVSAFSKNPDIAAEFVKFYTIGEGHDMWVELNGAFSAIQADVDKIMADPDADYGTKIAFSEAASIAKPRPMIATYPVYESVINTMWSDLALGSDPDACIENAINSYNSMIN